MSALEIVLSDPGELGLIIESTEPGNVQGRVRLCGVRPGSQAERSLPPHVTAAMPLLLTSIRVAGAAATELQGRQYIDCVELIQTEERPVWLQCERDPGPTRKGPPPIPPAVREQQQAAAGTPSLSPTPPPAAGDVGSSGRPVRISRDAQQEEAFTMWYNSASMRPHLN
jgi:hypothetical protein|eukprot:COSAG06_NODE_11398_length_1515_cov_2.315678_2_plen_169_part_00